MMSDKDLSEEEVLKILKTVLEEDMIQEKSKKKDKNKKICSTMCGPVGAVPTACPIPCT